jgi:sugar O-acyltransferase (sialic acid O-acetyltransferase NeuD family)
MSKENIILIGYAGHAYVVCDIFASNNNKVLFYCDNEEKIANPFLLDYLGNEKEAIDKIKQHNFFIAIGDNTIREKVYQKLLQQNVAPINAVDKSAIISSSAIIENTCVMIAARVVINALVKIGKGAIINTGAIIEHECTIGEFAHIAPGAVLCGNVSVGNNSFVGAGSVVKQGITIGSNVTIGAGSVVVKNVADGATVKGNPAK